MNDDAKVVLSLLDGLQGFARDRFDAQRANRGEHIPREVFYELGERGVLGLTAPKTAGGLDLSISQAARVMEQIGAIDLSLAACVAVQNFLCGDPIRAHASRRVLESLLPDMVAGKRLTAFAMTETAAGSDPRRIGSSATALAPDTWMLRGTKIWSGMAGWADVFCTFAYARTENGNPIGMTAFLLPSSMNGVTVGPPIVTMGLQGMVRNKVTYEDVILDEDSLLGRVGCGYGVAKKTMSTMRLYMSAAAVGGARRALQIAMRHVSRRKIAGGRMVRNPVVLDLLRATSARITTMTSLVTEAARYASSNDTYVDEFYLATKIITSEWSLQVANTAMQLAGARGYMESNSIPRFCRDLRAFPIIEGPTEALCSHLGGVVLRTPQILSRLPLLRENGNILNMVESFCQSRRAHTQSGSIRWDRLRSRYWTGAVTAHAIAAAALGRVYERMNDPLHAEAFHFAKQVLDLVLSEANRTRHTFDSSNDNVMDIGIGVTSSIGTLDHYERDFRCYDENLV
jgi:alkylation response protein AidB-like acyl-CoA dehydrogenase